MWTRFLRDGGWSDALRLVSPTLLRMMPVRDLEQSIRRLASTRKDEAGLRRARDMRRDTLGRYGVPVELQAPDENRRQPVEAETSEAETSEVRLGPREVGERALHLYFHQLYAPGPTLIDLRAARFGVRGRSLSWSGGRYFVEWDEAFLDALRSLYLGYYRHDRERYKSALDCLNLTCAEHELERHFGTGDATSVTFSLAGFRSTFIDVFRKCGEFGARLHPDFVPLGIHLACLYEHLEQVGVALDVRAAYDRAVRPVEETMFGAVDA